MKIQWVQTDRNRCWASLCRAARFSLCPHFPPIIEEPRAHRGQPQFLPLILFFISIAPRLKLRLQPWVTDHFIQYCMTPYLVTLQRSFNFFLKIVPLLPKCVGKGFGGKRKGHLVFCNLFSLSEKYLPTITNQDYLTFFQEIPCQSNEIYILNISFFTLFVIVDTLTDDPSTQPPLPLPLANTILLSVSVGHAYMFFG